jgi:CRISPR-associated protein Csm1
MDQREYHTLILAGLLHDVGKLLNKPGGGPHEEIGERLLRQSPYSDLLQAGIFSQELDFELLCHLVRWHAPYQGAPPVPDTYKDLQRRLSRADQLSSGERSWEETPRGEWKEAGTRSLDTIFASLELGRALSGERLGYRPVPLHPKTAFPQSGVEPLSETDYENLIQGFKAEFEYALRKAQDWTELEAWVYSLLERYTWVVPSDVRRQRPEVSLFDHSRTSCAIAAALCIRDQPEFAEIKPHRSTFLLIQGDISGVQDYIYMVANVGPGGVAKRLRARSFFITALTEVVAHRLRDELTPSYPLPIAAQIIGGGGQFVLLAPDLPLVRDKVTAIRKEVNQWLWDGFQGDLALVMEYLPLTQKDLLIENGDICESLDRLRRIVEASKSRRLGDLLQDEEGWIEGAFKWEPEGQEYPHGDCPSCRRLPARAPAQTKEGLGIPIDDRLCDRCHQDRILSERIVSARYIAYFRGRAPQDTGWLESRKLSLFEGDAARHAVLLNDLDDLERLDRRPYQLDGFGYETPTPEGPALVHYFANHVPRFDTLQDLAVFCTGERSCVQGSYRDDDTCGILVRPDGSRFQTGDFPILQTFGCLSAAAAELTGSDDETLHGAQLLGVLRADVDNLGLLFREGFGEVKSLSRLATLSRMTDLFLSGWVNETLSKPPEGSGYNRIYTVYAGGDDLCLVGPWDVIIDFTQYMADEFRRYVAGNPNVTLSAAVSVTKPKFPIATSAREAGQLLKAAKDAGRNRLNLFGVITRWSEAPDVWIELSDDREKQLDAQREQANLPWDELWKWAVLLDKELGRWREAKPTQYPVSPGFAHRLLTYAEMARRWEREQAISAEDMLYLARLSYDLGRNVVTSDAVQEDTKRKLSTLTQLSNRKVMVGMRLPITYALYRNRERSRER